MPLLKCDMIYDGKMHDWDTKYIGLLVWCAYVWESDSLTETESALLCSEKQKK